MPGKSRRFTVEILGDARSLEHAARRSRSALGLLAGVGRLGGSGLALLGRGALIAGAGLGTMAVAGATIGIKTAAGLEQAKIAFTTMLGSAKKADAFLRQLQKFAAATPFEFPELVRASQRLIAMGVGARDVVPYLTAIGDAVAGLGGGADMIDQVTTAIGQMAAKGKIQSDELLQLTEAGIPALKILADSYHVSAAKMQEMITKGKVLSSDALPKLIAGLEKGTKSTTAFGGMMAKQSKTLSGVWSTLKDTVSMALANMITPFVPSITKGLQSVSDWSAKAGVSLAKFAKDLLAGFNAAKAAVEGFDAAGGGLIGTMDGFITNIAPMKELIVGIGAAADGAKISIAPVGGLLVGIGAAGSAASKGIEPLGKLIKGTGGSAKLTAADMESFGFKVGQAIANVVNFIKRNKDTWASWAQTAIGAVKDLIGWLDRNKTAFATFALNVAQGMAEAAAGILRFGQHGLMGIAMVIRGLGDLVGAVFKAADLILGGFIKAFGWLPGVKDRVGGAREALAKFGESAKGAFERAAGSADRTAAALGRTASQMDVLAGKAGHARDQLNKIPSKTVQVTVRDNATGKLTVIRQTLEKLRDKTIRVTTAYLETGGPQHAPGLGRVVGRAATGARNLSRGGMYLVGELGPELVRLPQGADVFNDRETRKMTGTPTGIPGGGGMVNLYVTVNGFVGNEAGIAMEMERVLQRLKRTRGGTALAFQ